MGNPGGNADSQHSTGGRFGLNMMSAVSAQGEFRFMVIGGRAGATRFVEFIRRLVYGSEHKIFLIVDGHRTHKASKVRKSIESKSMKERFRLFFLSPYSPDLNPDERVWNDLKNGTVGREAIINPNQLHSVL